MKFKVETSKWVLFFEDEKDSIIINEIMTEVISFYSNGTYRIVIFNASLQNELIEIFKTRKDTLLEIRQTFDVLDRLGIRSQETYTYKNLEMVKINNISRNNAVSIFSLELRGKY